MLRRAAGIAGMDDAVHRRDFIDGFPGYRQVVSLVSPPVEALAEGEEAVRLAQTANDALAEMARGDPGRFPGFVAALPLGRVEDALAEAERAVDTLGAWGVQVFTHVNGVSLDRAGLEPLWDWLAAREVGAWLHPARGAVPGEYAGEAESRHETWWSLGWPYETSVAMLRLAFGGVFQGRPGLRILSHHAGGFIPVAEGRLEEGLADLGSRTPPEKRELVEHRLAEPLTVALRRFWADTATFGSGLGLAAAQAFFGPDQLVFATDMPFGPEAGARLVRATIAAVEALEITAEERAGVWEGNVSSWRVRK